MLMSLERYKLNGDPALLLESLEMFVASTKAYPSLCIAILEVSKHYEAGAKKYGENNWQKGIEIKYYLSSAVRHLIKFIDGHLDESHDLAFMWNILCAHWTHIHFPMLRLTQHVPTEKEELSYVTDDRR